LRLNKLSKLLFWMVFFESIGFVLGLLTQANIYPWYEHLNKSSLTPPGFIFSVVWTFLYGLLAVIAWSLSNQDIAYTKRAKVLFALQMLMNWTWTPLFFELHWLMPSALWLVGLTCLNMLLIIEVKNTKETIAWLLIPYLLWLVFASYLNFIIALKN
jgi:benzodiazapine receptor